MSILNEAMNDERRGFFDLGAWLEQGRCNPDVAYQVLAADLIPEATTDPENALISWASAERPMARGYETRLRPARFFPFDALPPPLGWFDGVRQRRQELGEQYVATPLETEQFDVLREARTAEVVREVDRLVRDAVLSAAPTERPAGGHDVDATVAGYLGLILDRGHLSVGREGTNEIVDLSATPLHWPILLLLNRQRTAFTTLDQLRAIWRDHGNEPDAGERTIANRVGRLSRVLRPLGVQIRGTRSAGWQLEETVER